MRGPHPRVDHQALAARLLRGGELSEQERAYLADMLVPARKRARTSDREMVWRVLFGGEDDGPASIRQKQKSQERRIEGAGVGRAWFFKVKKRHVVTVGKPAQEDLCSGKAGSGDLSR